ncbi:hypothetical protein [Acinetobacter sp. HY1485]|uniref:hypothetical protein n=1 Tax=Acinetobacter sp. HY1485 TaxID=2970918 RepID=UPI0022B964D6|nr:hypothetical protein [Acinetobacter sp. HY1485]
MHTLFLLQNPLKVQELLTLKTDADMVVLLADAVTLQDLDMPNIFVLEKDMLLNQTHTVLTYLQFVEILLQYKRCITIK